MSPHRAWQTTLAALCLTAAVASAAPPLAVEKIAGNLPRPVALTHAGDGSGRLFIALRGGRVLIHDGDRLLPQAFLDISGRVSCCFGERGMLGLAFHPDYESNGFFYVTYHAFNEESVISRFRVSADPDRADPGSEVELLRIPQPYPQHNVGQLAFGPDGYLYVGVGDGGSAGDPMNHAQDPGTLLGSILRIDVDGALPYGIPADNPFVDTAGAQPEIWAYGIRNPWRFSFDRRTGDLYFGDVGQDGWEEVNFQPGSSPGGENYGWSVMEGSSCFDPPTACDTTGLTLPILEYPHEHEHEHEGEGGGCAAVTGGFRYRGPATATLPRFYLFGDFCGGQIWGARRNAQGVWVTNKLLQTPYLIVAFGEDEAGNLYVIDFLGSVYRLVGRSTFEADFEGGNLAGWSGRQGNVAVTSPGLGGSEAGLEVALDGRPARSQVRSNHPRGETTFRLSFDFSANRADLRGRAVEILRLVDGVPHVKVLLEPRGAGYGLALVVRDADGSERRAGGGSIPAGGVARVALEWMRASGPAASDGEVFLLSGSRRIGRATDLANHGRRVRAVALGLPSGSAGTGAGSLRFDNYRSSP